LEGRNLLDEIYNELIIYKLISMRNNGALGNWQHNPRLVYKELEKKKDFLKKL